MQRMTRREWQVYERNVRKRAVYSLIQRFKYKALAVVVLAFSTGLYEVIDHLYKGTEPLEIGGFFMVMLVVIIGLWVEKGEEK